MDGVPAPGDVTASADTVGNFAQSTLYFMSRAGSSLFGAGDLDEVALYNRALTANEAADHHQRGLAGGGAPPGPNQNPTASFTVSPNPATAGQSVTFNGSASSDPDGTIAKYEWDLDGDGTLETDTGSNPQASRSYGSAGNVTVKLRRDRQPGRAGRDHAHPDREQRATEHVRERDPGHVGPAALLAHGGDLRLELRRQQGRSGRERGGRVARRRGRAGRRSERGRAVRRP